MISIIAAVGKRGELGLNGDLVFHLKEDMKYFRETTTGHPVLMGKTTFKSIGRPLPNRQNLVVTHHPEDLPDLVEPVRELRQFLEKNQDNETEIFVIGGASIYKEALPYAKIIYLTEVDAESNADVFFPDFDKKKFKKEIIKKGSENGIEYAFVKYTLTI